MNEPRWSAPVKAQRDGAGLQRPAPCKQDPLVSTLRRATTVASLDRIAAVVTAPHNGRRQRSLDALGIRSLLVEPKHKGTGYEILLSLLLLEERISASTPVLFLPVDHVVDDDEVMTSSLTSMAQWIADEPKPVYVLGAAPQGPHDELGYILPWHDAMQMPSAVYEFVEKPDMHRARKLINSGGLWNTFIFGGTLAGFMKLFQPRFEATIAQLRTALKAGDVELGRLYEGLTSIDFSRDVLSSQCDTLNVLRLPPCGWWPLKSPTLNRRVRPVAEMPRAMSQHS